jgi:uncharacterized protein YcnI
MTTLLKTLGALSLIGAAVNTHAHASFKADNAYGVKTAISGSTYYATLNAGHGCELDANTDEDTIKIEVSVPAETAALISAIRPADAAFGPATIETSDDGKVSKMIWTKSAAAAPADTQLYQVTFKFSLKNSASPAVNTPVFSKLSFPTVQTCENSTASWVDGDAPTLLVLPSRKPGWNKYTAQKDITGAEVKAAFADANIVWSNNAAWSVNPAIDALITNKLPIGSAEISIGTAAEFWVKY